MFLNNILSFIILCYVPNDENGSSYKEFQPRASLGSKQAKNHKIPISKVAASASQCCGAKFLFKDSLSIYCMSFIIAKISIFQQKSHFWPCGAGILYSLQWAGTVVLACCPKFLASCEKAPFSSISPCFHLDHHFSSINLQNN